ncbi:MAG: 4-(cytidine 5'-diphospho)-2-C-methyl-D-erythritol kinase, partial [Burkholderiales bacterium PBB4]
MQSLYDVPAPAKLNLFLHIIGRRKDGYHLLQSVFMLIDWSDRLHFELRTDGNISREDLTWQLPDDDLVLKAARALQVATGCTLGAHIQVEKSIPAQAGMGGGSSDAASAMLALNRLWKLNLTRTQLREIGIGLGADVPFFLKGRNAWVEGIGEQITPIAIPSEQFVVAKPIAGLDTRQIFSDPDLKR